MGALSHRSTSLLAFAILGAFLPAPSTAFIYYVNPTDIANHFMCAVNASMSTGSLLTIANSIRTVSDASKNYTGQPGVLRGLLPDGIVDKMVECESYHNACYEEDSDEGTGSSESHLANFNPLSSMNDTQETIPECEPDYYIPLVVRCYKEADLLYFKGINFNDEADSTVQLFRECLEAFALDSDDDQDK